MIIVCKKCGNFKVKHDRSAHRHYGVCIRCQSKQRNRLARVIQLDLLYTRRLRREARVAKR